MKHYETDNRYCGRRGWKARARLIIPGTAASEGLSTLGKKLTKDNGIANETAGLLPSQNKKMLCR